MTEYRALLLETKSITKCKKKALRSLEWLKVHVTIRNTAPTGAVTSIAHHITSGVNYLLNEEGILAKQILVSCIDIHPSLNEWTKNSIIDLAINQWLSDGEFTTDLVESFIRTINSILQDEPRQQYRILLLLNATTSKSFCISPLCLESHELRFSNWEDLRSEFSFTQQYPFEDDFTPCIISIETYSKDAALATAESLFDLWRVALNMAVFTPSFTYAALISSSLPLSKFLPSPIVILLDQDNRVANHKINDQVSKNYDLSDEEIKTAKKLLQRFDDSMPGSLTEFTVELARFYQQALDCTSYPDAYLALWQLLETLTLNTPGEKSVVDRRLSTLLSIDSGLRKDILEVLPYFRNKYVHCGIFPENSKTLVLILANFADHSLRKMFDLSEHLSTKSELDAYFVYSSTGDSVLREKLEQFQEKSTELQTDINAINYILRMRNP